MDTDLSDVGLAALEALEAQDQQEENAPEEAEEKETSDDGAEENTVDETGENNGEEENDTTEEGDEGEQEEGEPEEPKDEPKEKDLSDEEFEELAKKRGYAKEKTEDEKKSEEVAEAERKATMDKLTARPKEVDEAVWDELPEEKKIVYNALPYLVAEGKRGTVQVKTPDQLPDGFQFKDDKAAMKFQNDLQAQEMRAAQMMQALRDRAEREERQTAERAEAQKVVSEIEGLQKSGVLPSPKAKYGTAEFDNDPAVLLTNKVLAYRAQKQREGVMLNVKDSLTLYKAEHPEDFKKKEAKGDIERKAIAKKVAGNSKATSSAVNGRSDDDKAHYYKPGMSTEEVLDMVMNDMD